MSIPKMSHLFDISRAILPALAVWPGDARVPSEHMVCKADGAAVNLTTLALSPYTGSHAGAPYHITDGDLHPADSPLESYLGVTLGRREEGVAPATDFAARDLDGMRRWLVHTWVSDLPDDRRSEILRIRRLGW
jgi:kynurenine formamidase